MSDPRGGQGPDGAGPGWYGMPPTWQQNTTPPAAPQPPAANRPYGAGGTDGPSRAADSYSPYSDRNRQARRESAIKTIVIGALCIGLGAVLSTIAWTASDASGMSALLALVGVAGVGVVIKGLLDLDKA